MKAKKTMRRAPEASRDSKRRGAMLLDVLAGVRTPPQAAETLGVSLPGYYQLEERAMSQFLIGCETRPRGRQTTAQTQVQALLKENDRLKRELSRYQSLVRLTQRTVGVPPPALTPAKATDKRRKRNPTVRALRRAERLREEAEGESGAEVPESMGKE